MIPIQDPWGVLDLRRGATHDEVLDAYLRLRRVLRADSAALTPLECDAERRAELLAVEEAFRALSRNATLPADSPQAGARRAVIGRTPVPCGPPVTVRPRLYTATGRPLRADQS